MAHLIVFSFCASYLNSDLNALNLLLVTKESNSILSVYKLSSAKDSVWMTRKQKNGVNFIQPSLVKNKIMPSIVSKRSCQFFFAIGKEMAQCAAF